MEAARLGTKSEAGSVKDRLRTQLHLLMLLRVVTVSVVMGVTAYIQIRQKSVFVDLDLVLLYLLCAVFYCLTIVYVLAIKKGWNLWRLAHVQLTLDVAFTGLLIFITKGYEIFPFLFILTIINSSIILGRRGALLMALLSGFGFAVAIDLYYFRVIPVFGDVNRVMRLDDMIVSIFYNSSAFFIIALLSGSLSEQLQRADRTVKKQQIDLLDLENLNRHIVESLSSGLMTLSSDHRVTSFNRCAEEITGFRFSDVFNQPADRIFPEMTRVLDEGSSRWEATFVRRSDREPVILGFSCAPLRHQNGQVIGRIVNFQDVTVLRQMQDRVRDSDKLAAIGRLAAGIAHEIRNPLASMSGSIQILREELNPQGENRQLMDIVTREMERLNSLIREFLEFAKPKESNLEPMNLTTVLAETVAMGRQHLHGEPKAVAVALNVKMPEEAVWIRADSGKLKQVLWNLVLNAFQAIAAAPGQAAGEVEISLRYTPGAAILTVGDNGCGISEKNLNLIFEPFFTTKSQGTGLGLATVRRIVEENGWSIEVESVVEKGTTFTLTLPVIEHGH